MGTFKEITTTGAQAFRKLGVAKKIQGLREDLGLELFFYQHVFSVNRVRNCLVHRMGIVSPLDVEGDGMLKFTYRALELFSPHPEGSGEIIIDKPGVAGAPGGAIMMRAVDRTREFKVGERILFTHEEVTHVFSMLMQFSITTIEELRTLISPPVQTPATIPTPSDPPPNVPKE